MLICRFRTGDREAYGIVDGDEVREVQGGLFDGLKESGSKYGLSSVKLLPPVVPPTFYAAGINFPEHVTWGRPDARRGTQLAPKGRRGLSRGQRSHRPRRPDYGARRRHRRVAVRG